MIKLLVICGPTATGKTVLARKLADEFNGELVSADSRQVYRGMDIGTGKDLTQKLPIKKYELSINFRNNRYNISPYNFYGIPLWMYDVVNPDEQFSVSHYFRFASEVIKNIHKRGRLPVVVGGTGLYVRSLVSAPDSIDIPPDAKLRKELSLFNLTQLQEQIQRNYPHIWQVLNVSDRANPRRLVRKLEIVHYRSVSLNKEQEPEKTGYLPYFIGLTADLPHLYSAIDARVDKRVEEGIENEIAELLQSGYSWNMESLNTPGYKEWQPWFKDEIIKTPALKMKCIQAWKYNEHAYARRQLTWFRKEKKTNWYSVTGSGWEEKARKAVKKWYTNN